MTGTSSHSNTQRFRVGVDVGGTFTDAILYDASDEAIRRAKVLTTPEDQSVGTLQAIEALGIDPSEMDFFCHGFTAGINALLTRTGAMTGLLCTEGMRDLMDMGRLVRPQGNGLYDVTWIRPHQAHPIVHRRYIREIRERLRSDGSIHVALDEQNVREQVRFLRDEGVTSIAVCLLHAYRNAAHEERVSQIIAEEYPGAYVQTSAARMVVGEYTRTSAAVIDAYIGPIITRYLSSLKDRLAAHGFADEPQIMQMNAGIRTLEQTIRTLPLNAVESGPVAGMMGSKVFSEREGVRNLVCVDVGGTSTDIGIIVDGELMMTTNWEFEFGIPLGIPAVDVRSIGAGGGSIIRVDEAGTLLVGPQSAGSQPGPASYGFGGTEPTVTDAFVALGIIQPDLFLGGRMQLDRDAATAAFQSVADVLEMRPLEVAAGAIRLMTANIANEIMKLVLESGLNIRDFVLMPYGGAGSLNAVEVAAEIGVSEVVIPMFPGGFAALGMVVAPFKVQKVASIVERLDELPLERLNAQIDGMVKEVQQELAAQGVKVRKITAAMSGMYFGQNSDNEVPISDLPITHEILDQWRADFHALNENRFGYSAPETPIVAVSVSVEALGPEVDVPLPRLDMGTDEPPVVAVSVREISTDGHTRVGAPFYNRDLLLAGNVVSGPAVVDDGLATIYVPPGAVGRVDHHGNLRIGFDAELAPDAVHTTIEEEFAR